MPTRRELANVIRVLASMTTLILNLNGRSAL
jgi:hypothetical protein